MITAIPEAHCMAGDIVAVRGRGFFSNSILRLTGNTVSHVGLVVADTPVLLVTEALWRVKTHPIEDTIANAEEAYVLQPQNINLDQTRQIIRTATSFTADSYGVLDIGLQLLDVAFKTTKFTDHGWGLSRFPICSALVGKAYTDAGLMFGKETWESITPAEIYEFALHNHDLYNVVRIK